MESNEHLDSLIQENPESRERAIAAVRENPNLAREVVGSFVYEPMALRWWQQTPRWQETADDSLITERAAALVAETPLAVRAICDVLDNRFDHIYQAVYSYREAERRPYKPYEPKREPYYEPKRDQDSDTEETRGEI